MQFKDLQGLKRHAISQYRYDLPHPEMTGNDPTLISRLVFSEEEEGFWYTENHSVIAFSNKSVTVSFAPIANISLL